MFILAILFTYFLEENMSVDEFRSKVYLKIRSLLCKFINFENITSQRKLRLLYLYTCLPFIVGDIVINLIFKNNYPIISIINIFFFVLFVDCRSWKRNSKSQNAKQLFFVSDFANKFFVPSLWFIVLPYSTGLIFYFLVTEISNLLKENKIDSQVYNLTVDKMLFYVNFFPYLILYFLISLISNFEDVFHFLLDQKYKFSKSYYFLLNTLYEVILIAIRKENFKIEKNSLFESDINDIYIHQKDYTDDVLTYIIALLNRLVIFFLCFMALIYFIRLL